MKHTPISRRDFLKNLGMAGAGTLLAASPWLSAFSEVTNTSNEKCRLAIIGPGSRGRFLMGFLAKNPKVEIVALCDIYKPSIDRCKIGVLQRAFLLTAPHSSLREGAVTAGD